MTSKDFTSSLIYEAKVYLRGIRSTLSSTDMITESYYHGNEVRKRRVYRYPPKRMGEVTLYDFGFISFRLVERKPLRIIVDKDDNPQDKEIWIGGVLVGSGRQLTDKVFFLKGGLKMPKVQTQAGTLIKSEIPPSEGKEPQWVTYYVPKGSSFGFISDHHIEHLPRAGLNIHTTTLEDLIWKVTSNKDDWGLLHPIFYVFQRFAKLGRMGGKASLGSLRRHHRRMGGFDVADSDRISSYAVECANQMDLVMVPSKSSKKAYVDSGVKCRVEVVPHGVSELYSRVTAKLEKLPTYSARPNKPIPSEGLNVLFFFMHSATRKGADIVLSVMRRILADRPNVNFVLKAGYRSELCNLPRTTYINDWLAEVDLVKLYNACHILIAPTRGGGYEMNVLEGMARGLVVVASDLPAIQEYAKPYVLTAKSTGRKVKPLYDNPIHVGYGVDPDPEHFHELLEYAIDNYDTRRSESEKYAPEIREKHNWLDVAKLISKHLQEDHN